MEGSTLNGNCSDCRIYQRASSIFAAPLSIASFLPSDQSHERYAAFRSRRPSPPAATETTTTTTSLLARRKYGIAVWFSGYFAAATFGRSSSRPTSREAAKEENVKEVIWKSLARPVLPIAPRPPRPPPPSSLARVGKSATAVTEIDAAEIINKRKPRTNERDESDEMLHPHYGAGRERRQL